MILINRAVSRAMRTIVAVVAALVIVAPGFPHEAEAQSCSADVQCANGGQPMAQCIGDTLVVKRSICSGYCREVEVSRRSCGSRVVVAVTCQGATAVRREGGCNALLGTCDDRMEREACVPACSCRNKRLVVATGQCIEGVGCARIVTLCRTGCTCSPEPRCLDE